MRKYFHLLLVVFVFLPFRAVSAPPDLSPIAPECRRAMREADAKLKPIMGEVLAINRLPNLPWPEEKKPPAEVRKSCAVWHRFDFPALFSTLKRVGAEAHKAKVICEKTRRLRGDVDAKMRSLESFAHDRLVWAKARCAENDYAWR